MALLADPDFDPFSEVLLAGSPAGFAVSEPLHADTLDVIEAKPERMRLRAELAAPGWLVLGEWTYPGWQARINGAERPIYRADYGLRAVPLGTGAHEIEFVYRPTMLYAGAAWSLGTLLIVLVLLAGSRLRALRTRDA